MEHLEGASVHRVSGSPRAHEPQAAPFWIDLHDTGDRYTCRSDQTVLAAMEALGRRGIPVGCRGGGCGICKVRVTHGDYQAQKMSLGVVAADEQAAGVVLACRVRPTSDLKLAVVGRMIKALQRADPPDSDRASSSPFLNRATQGD